MLKHAPTLAIGSVDTVETEQPKVWGCGVLGSTPSVMDSWVNRRNECRSGSIWNRPCVGLPRPHVHDPYSLRTRQTAPVSAAAQEKRRAGSADLRSAGGAPPGAGRRGVRVAEQFLHSIAALRENFLEAQL